MVDHQQVVCKGIEVIKVAALCGHARARLSGHLFIEDLVAQALGSADFGFCFRDAHFQRFAASQGTRRRAIFARVARSAVDGLAGEFGKSRILGRSHVAGFKAPEDTTCLGRTRMLGHTKVMAIAAAGNKATGQPQQAARAHASAAGIAGAQGFDGTKSSAQSGHGKLLEQTRYSLLRPEVIIPARCCSLLVSRIRAVVQPY